MTISFEFSPFGLQAAKCYRLRLPGFPMETLISLAATGGYIGYIPLAPGTFGSLEGLLLGWLVFAPIMHRSPATAVALFALLFAGACWIAGRAERIFAQHDSSRIVIDEILGMAAATFLLPARWPWMLAAFGLFRLFDILKPYPASLIDRQLRGGIGVMLDDLAAAIYANLILQAALRLL
ncbi:MAG TPA: phosphatidylglycerophosphatase A [Candidatus Binataceae bacterium]|nr:phosphatidylglycerophosphatase A [Candidatus Binataceae bacterium]